MTLERHTNTYEWSRNIHKISMFDDLVLVWTQIFINSMIIGHLKKNIFFRATNVFSFHPRKYKNKQQNVFTSFESKSYHVCCFAFYVIFLFFWNRSNLKPLLFSTEEQVDIVQKQPHAVQTSNLTESCFTYFFFLFRSFRYIRGIFRQTKGEHTQKGLNGAHKKFRYKLCQPNKKLDDE